MQKHQHSNPLSINCMPCDCMSNHRRIVQLKLDIDAWDPHGYKVDQIQELSLREGALGYCAAVHIKKGE